MFSSRSVQIAAVFSDVFGQALPNLCRSFYNETKAEMFFSVFAVALLAEGVDRNATHKICWMQQNKVALLAEGVDRNVGVGDGQPKFCRSPSSRRAWIEIRNKGVNKLITIVALLAEGVDRNTRVLSFASKPMLSPSSRRAWIEIIRVCKDQRFQRGRPPRGGRG